MMENTNETQFNQDNLFVDNISNNVSEQVDDSNDFYDDEIIEQPISKLDFENISDDNPKEIFIDPVEEPIVEVNESEDNSVFDAAPVETPKEVSYEDSEINNSEDSSVFDATPVETSEEISYEEPKMAEFEVEDPSIDNEIISDDEIKAIEDDNFLKPIEMDDELKNTNSDKYSIKETPFEVNLSNEDMDKMIDEDSKKDNLDDSYVLSNFDVLFDSLYNDVNGANNFISNLIEQKKSVNINEVTVAELNEKLEKEKQEFAKYIDAQKQSIEAEKQQCNEYVKNQRIRLQNEEDQFNADMEAAREERKLAEESLKIEKEKLDDEKQQFEKYKEIEEEKIKTEKEKLLTEKEQFIKEKEIEFGKIKNGQKELQAQREQFAKSKELEEKKLELESKNLSQSCARFKELVSQFNSGFQQLPEDN